MIVGAILSGAASAILGAGAYHYADSVRTQSGLIQSLNNELLANKKRLNEEMITLRMKEENTVISAFSMRTRLLHSKPSNMEVHLWPPPSRLDIQLLSLLTMN